VPGWRGVQVVIGWECLEGCWKAIAGDEERTVVGFRRLRTRIGWL